MILFLDIKKYFFVRGVRILNLCALLNVKTNASNDDIIYTSIEFSLQKILNINIWKLKVQKYMFFYE